MTKSKTPMRVIGAMSFAEVLAAGQAKQAAYEQELAALPEVERQARILADTQKLNAALNAYYKAGGSQLFGVKLP